MISGWLFDEQTKEHKINKLRGSLVEWAVGSKERGTQVGTPPKSILRIFGKEWIREMRDDIMSILKRVKKNKDKYQDDNISELFVCAFKDFVSTLEEDLKKGQDIDRIKDKLKRYHLHSEALEESRWFYPVSDCIENDEKLKSEFIKFKWPPHALAFKITAKLLGVRPQSIKDILYRKEK
jgi:hypothetical protein